MNQRKLYNNYSLSLNRNAKRINLLSRPTPAGGCPHHSPCMCQAEHEYRRTSRNPSDAQAGKLRVSADMKKLS